MNISRVFLLILLSFIISACKPETSSEQAKSTQVVVDAETTAPMEKKAPDKNCQFVLGFDAWEPYQYADVGERVAGLDIELVAAVVEGMGCKLTYQ